MTYIYLCMSLIKPHYKVLDVGGAFQPLRRADAVIDFLPFDHRNEANSFFQKMKPRYSKSTWFSQDICDHTKRWPFKDKEFDFVVCAQTLEDVRDPLYVCEEMRRVGKRGFIETPSRFYEQVRGMEVKGLSGTTHHRWILTQNNGGIVFNFKSHDIHKKEYQLFPPFWNKYPFLNPNYEAFKFIWEDSFSATEDAESAIRNDGAFYRETIEIAAQIGYPLWDITKKLPVDMEGQKRLNPYTLERTRSQESLEYELQFPNL